MHNDGALLILHRSLGYLWPLPIQIHHEPSVQRPPQKHPYDWNLFSRHLVPCNASHKRTRAPLHFSAEKDIMGWMAAVSVRIDGGLLCHAGLASTTLPRHSLRRRVGHILESITGDGQ